MKKNTSLFAHVPSAPLHLHRRVYTSTRERKRHTLPQRLRLHALGRSLVVAKHVLRQRMSRRYPVALQPPQRRKLCLAIPQPLLNRCRTLWHWLAERRPDTVSQQVASALGVSTLCEGVRTTMPCCQRTDRRPASPGRQARCAPRGETYGTARRPACSPCRSRCEGSW